MLKSVVDLQFRIVLHEPDADRVVDQRVVPANVPRDRHKRKEYGATPDGEEGGLVMQAALYESPALAVRLTGAAGRCVLGRQWLLHLFHV